MTSGESVLAIDIGATKFAAALVDAEGVMTRRQEMPVGADPDATLARLVGAVTDGVVVAGVGIGSAGPIDALAGTVSPVNIAAWRGFPLVAAVAELLPDGTPPVRLAGDAQCMALGEWWRGAQATAVMLGMVVSTGVGGGIVLDGVPYLGPTGNAGHIGHITVDRDGEACPCGGVGCVETIASGPSMVRWALANGWQPFCVDTRAPAPNASAAEAEASAAEAMASGTAAQALAADVVVSAAEAVASRAAAQALGMEAVASGADIQALGADIQALGADAKALAADARRGVVVAQVAFRRAADALATAIITTAALFDVDNVVIGGGVAASGETLLGPLRQAIKRQSALGYLRRLRVDPTALGRDAGLYGAAALVLPVARHQAGWPERDRG